MKINIKKSKNQVVIKELPRYSYSRIANYFICPKRFDLSLNKTPFFADSTKKVMEAGNTFEAVALRDKNGILPYASEKKALMRVIRQGTEFKESGVIAEKASEENSYIRFERDYKNEFLLTGEIDYRGHVYIPDRDIDGRYITDLKYTGDVTRTWKRPEKKEDIFQVSWYSWNHYQQTGEMLNGLYLVYEGKYEEGILATFEVIVSDESYRFIENLINRIHNDPGRLPRDSYQNCLGYGKRVKQRCPYLQYCQEGRKLVGIQSRCEFDNL